VSVVVICEHSTFDLKLCFCNDSLQLSRCIYPNTTPFSKFWISLDPVDCLWKLFRRSLLMVNQQSIRLDSGESKQCGALQIQWTPTRHFVSKRENWIFQREDVKMASPSPLHFIKNVEQMFYMASVNLPCGLIFTDLLRLNLWINCVAILLVLVLDLPDSGSR
jgi:hypothetical protein